MNMNPFKNFDVRIDDRGIATITLDVPDRPLNVLNRDVVLELDQIVHDLENSDGVKLAVFQSGKESGFLAGADVDAIAKIESATQAMRLIEVGQTLFRRIEWLPMPTVAIIHGPCLGGGLELALACDYRVARSNSSTKIGVPEIKLGLIPGWGGTQRLPRVAGLSNALPMILTGKNLSAGEAHKIGLIDEAIDPGEWEQGLSRFLDLAARRQVPNSASRRPWWQRVFEATRLGRRVIFHMTEKATRSKANQYPALAAAIRAAKMSFDNGPDGFLRERDEFVDLLATPTCRNLLGLFFARERARSLQTWSANASQAVHDDPIRIVGIVGAGAMGAGIGQLAALRGFDVVMNEIDQPAAASGRHRIEKLFDSLARRKGWSASEKENMLRKISISCDINDLAGCDLVVEAAVEREDIKHQIFAALDRTVNKSCILATNTSSLSVTKMAAATSRVGRVAGLHFFNPVHRMELVEVVRAANSDDATVNRLVAFVKALGKTPVVTTDSAGFLVNRVLFPYLGEAILMVGDGYDPAQIDKQVRRFGMPMGPLQLLDQVGLDVALHVASSLDGTMPEVTPVVEKLSAMVDQGNVGRKAGVGFYRYRKGKPNGAAPLPFETPKAQPIDDGDFLDDGLSPVQRRLVYPMLAEAVRCHEEGVVEQPWAIDLAMVLGTGFAPHRGGPLHVIDSIGQRQVLANLRSLRSQLGNRFAAPKQLIQMSDQGDTFFGHDAKDPTKDAHPGSLSL